MTWKIRAEDRSNKAQFHNGVVKIFDTLFQPNEGLSIISQERKT